MAARLRRTRARRTRPGPQRWRRRARRSAGTAGEIGDGQNELGRIDGLGQVQIESGREGAAAVLRATIRGQREGGEPGSGSPLTRTNPAYERVAVFARHLDVRDEDVGRPGVEDAHGGGD